MIKRFRNKKGFTLAELLIVVAIIGVLVAISVPIFTSQLEKSREATDEANIRAAMSQLQADYLNGDNDTSTEGNITYSVSNGAGTATITLEQKTTGWQDGSDGNIGNISKSSLSSVGDGKKVVLTSSGTDGTITAEVQ